MYSVRVSKLRQNQLRRLILLFTYFTRTFFCAWIAADYAYFTLACVWVRWRGKERERECEYVCVSASVWTGVCHCQCDCVSVCVWHARQHLICTIDFSTVRPSNKFPLTVSLPLSFTLYPSHPLSAVTWV